MPTPDEVLAGPTAIANRWFVVAVAWHLVVGLWLVGASRRWRPSPRLSGLVLTAPPLCVSVLAWASGSRFDAVTFLVLAAVLALISLKSNRAEVQRQPWASAVAALLIGFAWLYPHFLQGWPQITYVIAAPMGLLPAPTLALVMGFSLLGYGPSSRAWPLTLAFAGFFYGAFGVLRLGVFSDVALIVGALGLTGRALGRSRSAERRLQLVT